MVRAVFRRTMTYTVVAFAVAGCILLVAFAIYLYGEVLIALAVAIPVILALVLYVRAQRQAWLVIHDHGLRLIRGSRQDVVLWLDIAALKPTFSYVAAPSTLIDLSISKRSGGRLVLRNNWAPRGPFYGFISELLTPPTDPSSPGPA